MRIVHTSDWHLGRTLHGVDLLEYQSAYLDHLVELVRDESADAVVIAGDVYDRAIPPVEAVDLLSESLVRLSEQAPVILTSGNHDSAIRLGFGAGVMGRRVHIRTRLGEVGTPVIVPARNQGAEIAVYPLPYLDPDAARVALAEQAPAKSRDGAGCQDREGAVVRAAGEAGADAVAALPRSHEAVMRAAMRRVGQDLLRRRASSPCLRAMVMGHAFVVGGEASESERDIRVGGVDSVPTAAFSGFGLDYVALGHLHGPQSVTIPGGTHGRYSGSPLAYSFSEIRHHKSTVIVDFATPTTPEPPGSAPGDGVPGATPAGPPPTIRLIRAPVPRRLAEIRGSMADLLGPYGEPHVDDWVRVTVTDEIRPADFYAQVKARFPHALQIVYEPPRGLARETIRAVGPARDPLDVTREFVNHVTGRQPAPAEDAVLRSVLEQVMAMERSS